MRSRFSLALTAEAAGALPSGTRALLAVFGRLDGTGALVGDGISPVCALSGLHWIWLPNRALDERREGRHRRM